MIFATIFSYFALGIAFLAILVRVLKYARAPLSMRWELYPVPHEKGRAEYGGSYLEELDWWTKPRHSDMFNELREMFMEIILLKGVYHHNRKVWLFSFPFHFGMYLSIGWLVLLLGGGIMQKAGVVIGPEAGFWGILFYYATPIIGYPGLALSAFGALGLFIWRMGNSEQRAFNTFAEYFNLVLVFVVTVTTLIIQATADPAFGILRSFAASLATFSAAPEMPAALVWEIFLVALLIMYIPLSRMSHFVAKYFLYHSVRWNDEANEKGSAIEKRIIELLHEKMTWSASHVIAATWADLTKEPKNE